MFFTLPQSVVVQQGSSASLRRHLLRLGRHVVEVRDDGKLIRHPQTHHHLIEGIHHVAEVGELPEMPTEPFMEQFTGSLAVACSG